MERAPIIRSKLAVPSLRGHLVERSRLDRRLADLISRFSVVCVVATAGAGKTTAVVRATGSLGLPVAWLGVDASETSAGRLLTYLEATLALRVPAADGVATRALRAGVQHQEAAGLLAEALGESPVLLVLDDLERLVDSGDAFGVIEGFVRYATPETRIVLISREEPPLDFGPTLLMGRVGALGESELAFTVDEAAKALELAGASGVDPGVAVAATGGWVAGVVFEAWRSAPDLPLINGEADPLHGYLSSGILARLDAADRDFLVETSVLDEVSAERASGLGHPDAAQRLASLRGRHLPLTWRHYPLAMRVHPRFREFLRERLERRGEDLVSATRAAYGRLLVSEERDEEAVEELLAGGADDAAVAAAEHAIIPVLDRLDLNVARRWLALLAHVRPLASPRLTTAELMLLIASEEYARAIEVSDRLHALGRRDEVARSSPRAAALMAWCAFHAGRLDDARGVLERAERTSETAAMWYCLSLADTEAEDAAALAAPITGGPLDALVMRVDYYHGFLDRLLVDAQKPWTRDVAAAWRVGALIALGRTEEAVELFESTRRARRSTWLSAVAAADLLYELGRKEEARRALDGAGDLVNATGSRLLQALSDAIEAKLQLRHRRDVPAGHAVLDRLDAQPWVADYAFLREQSAAWRGLALLMENRDDEALGVLRATVASMQAGHRLLYLPTAATYLAEAEWRAGDEEASDEAVEVALDASERMGSRHVLLQALRDFPTVAARRIDAEPSGASRWHRLGRALRAERVELSGVLPARILVREFGQLSVEVDDRPAPLRLTKSCLLLAYLATTADRADRRSRVLEALFDAGRDGSVAAYLRQAAHRARQVLPEGVLLELTADSVTLRPPLAVVSESVRFEALLEESLALQGRARFDVLVRALSAWDGGDYLPRVDLAWANDRRLGLQAARDDALVEAGILAFDAGMYSDAEELASRAIAHDPVREDAWQVRMQTMSALGDYPAVLRAYRECERELAAAGAKPTETTVVLLERLRR